VVNLRFHIVSITAVFLALAIGIFMGSTLLQRATVDQLKARQRSLDEKIDDRVRENAAFRAGLGSVDEQNLSFSEDGLPPLLGQQLRDSVLLVGVRGIDETAVAAMEADLVAAGATSAGTLWLGDALDLEDQGVRDAAATALQLDDVTETDLDAVRDAAVDRLADLLEPSTSPEDPALVSPTASAAATQRLLELESAGLVEWEAPASGPRELPSSRLRLVVTSGEGAVLAPESVPIPFLREMARRRQGAAVAIEVMNIRSSVGEIERRLNGDEPVRGSFVGLIRDDDELSGRLTTIDNGDKAFGQLALVLVLTEPLDGRVGQYGETDSSERQFPPSA
jgi:hypothetical protein